MPRSKKEKKNQSADMQDLLDPLSATMKSAFLKDKDTLLVRKGRAVGSKKSRSEPRKKGNKASAISPLAPDRFPEMAEVKGVELCVGRTGEKYKGRDDLLIGRFPKNTSVAGVFTQSETRAAPVDWCRQLVADGRPSARYLIVNAGNANAFTGKAGDVSVKSTVAITAQEGSCRQKEVFVASTGVIGEPLNDGKLTGVVQKKLARWKNARWEAAAGAIMTTDTFAKAVSRTAVIDGQAVTINGIAKGSGMIAPDMATMLAFVFTDANITSSAMQTMLMLGMRESFNAITVDSDTSTNDTVLMFATGAAMKGEPVGRAGDRRLSDFRAKLMEVLQELAWLIVRDGEGASKFVSVEVTGAKSAKSARVIAQAIANSPLVKTAIAGEDANWGRVVMAVGKAGESADRDRLAIYFGEHCVAEKGQRHPDYSEKQVSQYMTSDEISLRVDVGVGSANAKMWTCDLTHGYISINADYRS